MEEIELLAKDRLKQVKRLRELSEQPSSEQSKEQLRQFRAAARDEQKQRIDKQNWIMNILRSAKQLSVQRKRYAHPYEARQFVEVSSAVMQAVHPEWSQPPPTEEELQYDFTEFFVNMYADFFDRLSSQFEFKLPIKQLIRPNNRTIVIDLVKYLVNFTRDYFKQATLVSQAQQETIGRILPAIDGNIVVTAPSNSCVGYSPSKIYHAATERRGSAELTEPFVPALVVRPSKANLSTYELLQLEEPISIYCKSQRPARLSSRQQREDLAVASFLKMKDLNVNIRYRCESWRNSITGSHNKYLPYNYSGLYTQQQIERLQSEKVGKPKPLLATSEVVESELKAYVKAYIEYEAQNQLKPRPLRDKYSLNRYKQYVVLRYDHRYPLEVVKLEKRYESLGSENRLQGHTRSSVVLYPQKDRFSKDNGSPVKKRDLKGLFGTGGAQSVQLLTDPPKLKFQQPRLDLCIVDRSKVLRIRRDVILPEVCSPAKLDLLSVKQLTSETAEQLTQPYSSRSNRLSTNQQPNKDEQFRNVRMFALSKNISDPPPLDVLRLYHQQRNFT